MSYTFSSSQTYTYMNLCGSRVCVCMYLSTRVFIVFAVSKENEFLFNSNEVNGGITTMERELIMASAKQKHNNNNNSTASYAITRSSAFEYTCTFFLSRTRFFAHITYVELYICTGFGFGSGLGMVLIILWFGSFVCDWHELSHSTCNSIQRIIQFHQLPVKIAQISHRLFLIANCCKQWTGRVCATTFFCRFFSSSLAYCLLPYFF